MNETPSPVSASHGRRHSAYRLTRWITCLLALSSWSALLLTTGCIRNSLDSGSEGHTTPHHLTVGRVRRSYRLHLPAHYDSSHQVPLVIALHGYGGRTDLFERSIGMSDKADEEGFIVAYPQALGDPSNWHTGIDGSGARDDIAFVRALIETIAARYPIDRRRVYVAGHSNGGVMAYRLAATLSDELAAVGVTAGTIGFINEHGDTVRIERPEHPVAVIHFHGLADPSVPYHGGPETDGPDNVLGVAQTVRFWTHANACPPNRASRVVSNDQNVIVDTYSPCAAGSAVVLYTIVDGTHRWPGDDIPWYTFPGPGITDVNATDRMWDFFVAHPRGRDDAGFGPTTTTRLPR